MKLPAIVAAFFPWALLVVAIFAQNLDQPDAVERMSLLWIGFSPVFIGAAILIAYREGQWSVKK